MIYRDGKPLRPKKIRGFSPLSLSSPATHAVSPRRAALLERCSKLVDLSTIPELMDLSSQKEREEFIIDAEKHASECAGYLTEIAMAHHRMGKWPIEVVAWLIMVRDSFSPDKLYPSERTRNDH